jgi:hypothetical protein
MTQARSLAGWGLQDPTFSGCRPEDDREHSLPCDTNLELCGLDVNRETLQ